ncbi:MAG: hypothetical protein DRJ61_07590 [Acidobacteria bacterium]|nr:MAG: hypothetical protein DRJ61_07590 [Acidobacteriota bacterium]
MHDGCSGSFASGTQVVDKVRMMGFNIQPMPMPMMINCSNCSGDFEMVCFEGKCPECNMVFGVTPCHAFDPTNVVPAGVDY